MLNRRSFVISTATFILSQGLSGCSNDQTAFKVLLLKGSIPTQLLDEFKSQLAKGKSLNFRPEEQLQKLFDLLQIWQKKPDSPDNQKTGFNLHIPLINPAPPIIADLITLGDVWLSQAIEQKLIEPLNSQDLQAWKQLPERWQSLVKRNEKGQLDEAGKIWGAPYRWGCTLIVYDSDKFKDFGWTPTDWRDLWRKEIQGRISLLNEPREVIGFTLKKLGYSYNEADLNKVSDLKKELLALQKQVKFYDSQNYLQPLILGDTSVAVGWSGDILPILNANPNLKAIIPQSGTALWTDIWVKPKSLVATKSSQSLVYPWINFCWQAKSAMQISLLTKSASPVIFNLKPEELPQTLRDNSLLYVEQDLLNRSEFLFPISTETQKQYEELWQTMRQIL
jgi:putative spermidine/putrescine transport system substrate-binding protein